jgi:hypothetical protein
MDREDRLFRGKEAVMEWVLKLEASSGWGEVETIEVGRLERRVAGLTAEELGLTLAESKTLLGELGRLVLQAQVEEFITCARVCGSCLGLRRLRDQRTRKIQTLFGTITVDAPRISVCPCRGDPGFVDVSWSSLTELLPDRCTPELRRLQAELSAQHSYREAARLLETFLPCAPGNHATMRNRTHRAAADLEAAAPPELEPAHERPTEIMMAIDGAHIRAAHGYQSRYIDVTVGKIEVAGRRPRRFALAPKGASAEVAGRRPRRFALAPKGASAPLATLRKALREQGWRPGRTVTVLCDGESALPGLVRAAVDEPITCILDWWHISMRVQHIEQALRGVYAAEPPHRAGLEIVEWRIKRLRHLIWNGYHDEARRELYGMRHMASEVVYLNGERFRSPIARLLWNCDDLWRYLTNNVDALINYGARYRSKLPISTSRAEGCVDEIANARMAKKQRMRWSPRGAHCVATVRAAVLDGRFGTKTDFRLAA